MIMTENSFVMKRRQILYLIFISGVCSFTVGSSDFHLIDLSKTYEEAKSYCREMYTDLATVHNSAEMNNLITLVSTSTARAWIGLEAGDVWMWHWSWPDQKVDFLNWKAGEPQTKNQDACVAMDQHGEWFESDCGTKRSFVCRGSGETSGLAFVADTKSWRDAQNHCRGLSSDLVSIHSEEENEAVQNVSVSQNVWIGLFKDPWKWSDGSNSSFRYWKPFQPNYLEDQDCAAAIFKDKGQWNDLKCGGKRNFVCRGGNLILIQQNMTWIEAMSYCREHYIDLVHITTKEIQDKVAEKVKNATSQYVWLGLRYTCKFNFWFWTRSTTGCYQNWALGQGSEGKYDCGVTGAIEATGRQQWVGLPETEKLNFICYACAG
ncbi:macrophage mannose receptor 1 isoform X2 [Toxotes jaculatrix]|uniref:macrophage mannose receptor 1 isoform X2 n=1 Tax=Toxotes jaculatrix TaxID=941984 RepID=UPI001B3ADDCD|nr:macrophage mannose receptor 1 isoform X2 [Toxotes jaculatrix]